MKNFLGNSDIYDGAYGYRLIHNLGYNQIYKVYEILKYNLIHDKQFFKYGMVKKIYH